MSSIEFGEATTEERLWCARLMASSEPWIALGRGEDACRAACVDPDYVILVARRGGRSPCLTKDENGGASPPIIELRCFRVSRPDCNPMIA